MYMCACDEEVPLVFICKTCANIEFSTSYICAAFGLADCHVFFCCHSCHMIYATHNHSDDKFSFHSKISTKMMGGRWSYHNNAAAHEVHN
jgi:hypothetical protein